MSSALERPPARPAPSRLRVPAAVTRFGHLLAAAGNGVLLWVSHQLLDWGWPAFLTRDFELVLGIVTASFVASIVVNIALAFHRQARFRALTDLVTSGFAMAVVLRTWEVFPFDFAGYGRDWSGLVHLGLVVGILVTGVSMVATLITLLTGPDDV